MLAVLHVLGTIRFWYWTYWWFDNVTHLLGGFWVGGMVLWARFLRGNTEYADLDHERLFLNTAVMVFAVAIVWEITEYVGGAVFVSPLKQYVFDTATDLLSGVLGGVLATGYFLLNRYYYRN